jgi:hypothetical protein
MPHAINAQIDAKIDDWVKLLLDTSSRNKLISAKFGPLAALELIWPDAKTVWNALQEGRRGFAFAWKRDLLNDDSDADDVNDTDSDLEGDAAERERFTDSEETVRICKKSTKLGNYALTRLTDKRLDSRLKRLQASAKEGLEERGVNTLYVAVGFLQWFESDDSSAAHESPLLLIPVNLVRQNLLGKWSLTSLDGTVERNECLAERLRNDFQFRIPEFTEPDDGADAIQSFDEFIGEMQNRVANATDRRWNVLAEKVALGIFNSRKLPMAKDLDKNRSRISEHPLCRAIAGDCDAVVRDPTIRVLEMSELDDEVPVTDVLHVLPADSSQHAAIEAVKKGLSLVLDGPPGTGKSQTIANIIADRIAAGKSVLFVSEKAAALNVVLDRLRECRLDDFSLALHDPNKVKRATVCEEFKKSLALKPTVCDDLSVRQRQQQERRQRLNRYVRELHLKREPLGLSFFQVFGRRARLAKLVSQSRLRIADVATWDIHRLESVCSALAQLREARTVFDDPDRHPWRGCLPERMTEVLRDDLRYHLERLTSGLADVERIAREWSALGWLREG